MSRRPIKFLHLVANRTIEALQKKAKEDREEAVAARKMVMIESPNGDLAFVETRPKRRIPSKLVPELDPDDEKDGFRRYDFMPFVLVSYKMCLGDVLIVSSLAMPYKEIGLTPSAFGADAGFPGVLANSFCHKCQGYNLHLCTAQEKTLCVCVIREQPDRWAEFAGVDA